MRSWWLAATFALVGAAPAARAGDVYRSVDGNGHAVYSNVPMGDGERTEGTVESASAHGIDEAAASPAPDGDSGDFAAQAMARRRAIEQSVHEIDGRVRAVETQIEAAARVRTRNAAGTEATGGVRAAANVATDDERALTEERDRLRHQADDTRASYAKLRDEVVARLGALPDWWVELR